jgi:hypothetical protein
MCCGGGSSQSYFENFFESSTISAFEMDKGIEENVPRSIPISRKHSFAFLFGTAKHS